MNYKTSEVKIHRAITCFIGFVWFINGFLCKVLNLVPRHREIVARVLGYKLAAPLTLLIGIFEIGMAIWIFSGVYSKQNAVVQMLIIAAMNALEFFLAPDLLLWGRGNSFFAFLFILLIFYNEFYLKPGISDKSMPCCSL